ncbi:MAG: DUF4397 domain-containing protein [Alcaligenaceae bacterium]|nr:DUF4397 domain-containing protein [Alcaligenaceae bacterium]
MQHRQLLLSLCQRVAMLFLAIASSVSAQTSGGLYAPDPPPGSTYIRFLVSQSDGPVDILVDGRSGVTKLPAGQASPYLILPGGKHSIELRSSGASQTTLKSEIEVSQGRAATVAFTSLAANSLPLLLTDKTAANQLKALLTLYNLQPGGSELDVLIADANTKVLAGVAASASASIAVNPISVKLAVVKRGETSALAQVQLSMAAGGAYSIFVLNDVNGKLQVLSSQNRTEPFTKR